MAKKQVYFFGNGKAEGEGKGKELLGGKGLGLAEMTALGIPVPAGFTITTEVCARYYKSNRILPPELKKEVSAAITKVEKVMGAKFGDPDNPLLFSVRSGARASMPGMMDTILNLGLNDKTVKGLIARTGNERFGYDSYRRLVQMYADVVDGLDREYMESALTAMKKDRGVALDTELTAADLKELVVIFKEIYRKRLGRDFPQPPDVQLWHAVHAVFDSWMNPRAITYRKLNNIPESWGTAVNVQAMVFGNMGDDCATGVAFTRNPATGEKKFFGEFLVNSQGEDVVAGIRTPQPITKEEGKAKKLLSLEEYMPDIFRELETIYKLLEKHYRDMQDIEFTVQNRKLWMLQTRTGKRTARAAIKIAVDMVKEGLITKEEAILRIDGRQLDQLLHPTFDPDAEKTEIARGLAASPGAASGKVVFNADTAEEWAKNGEKVILVRNETSPEDIHGMNVAEGILTARGGITSHAAVVARGMGKCCVSGCEALRINNSSNSMTVGNYTVHMGDVISLDGSTGAVYLGKVPTVQPKESGEFAELMRWVDAARKLGVRTNADTPHDAAVARRFGAEGIGLCRTEHMFFEEERIMAVRQMILADTPEGRREALDKLLPMQKKDFIGIFKVMNGLPVTIRLLDPPLHEFLPHTDGELKELAEVMQVDFQKLKYRNESLKEANPMLGHRGCRLGISYPEIYDMQVEAILEAACALVKSEKTVVKPEIMIPLVGMKSELEKIKERIDKIAERIFKKYKTKVNYLVGTMVELPRAALTADEIAEVAEFFSFGTNDLTQMTIGLSRDDAGTFLPRYVSEAILPFDPFVSIDINGVGKLVKMGVELGRKTRKNLKVGICGEHGGDPASIKFCNEAGLDYVSCSPYRVPIARLAAAQAAVAEKRAKKSVKKAKSTSKPKKKERER
ncbi:MAG: pyruvate, phosphate dikinase [Myxococcota bacterium]